MTDAAALTALGADLMTTAVRQVHSTAARDAAVLLITDEVQRLIPALTVEVQTAGLHTQVLQGPVATIQAEAVIHRLQEAAQDVKLKCLRL